MFPILLYQHRLVDLPLLGTPLEAQHLHPEDHVLRPVLQVPVQVVLEHVAACGQQPSIIQVILASHIAAAGAGFPLPLSSLLSGLAW